MFLWHFPWGRPHWALPSTLALGARTFLTRQCRPRSPGLVEAGSRLPPLRAQVNVMRYRSLVDAGQGKAELAALADLAGPDHLVDLAEPREQARHILGPDTRTMIDDRQPHGGREDRTAHGDLR